MTYAGYRCLRIERDAGVVFVTIDHPPINLLDLALMTELDRLGSEIETDPQAKVVVFDSADPDFFIAHADVSLILQLPKDVTKRPRELGFFHAMVDRFRTMPKVSIAKLEGRARGGGSELVSSMDMRFAAIGRAVLSQPEVAVGIIPGGSATQRLPRLMGRGRALEAVLGCEDFPAELAERYGWVNRALPADEIGPFVERLARRIASFPRDAIALAKRAVNAADQATTDGLLEEAHCFNEVLRSPDAETRMQAFLDADGQTREVELDMSDLVAALGPKAK